MSSWHREHPELAGTDADPWMASPAHREAVREVECYSRFGRSLDSMIAQAEEERDSAMCECGHRYDEHDADPPGGGHCELCSCEHHEEV
jgi:hypothetical protein